MSSSRNLMNPPITEFLDYICRRDDIRPTTLGRLSVPLFRQDPR